MFFKDTNYSTNITTATPERVYVLCKNIERNKTGIRVADLKQLMEPDYVSNGGYFPIIKDAAIDLGLIKEFDNYLSLNVDSSVLESTATMRKYINNHMDQFSKGTFYILTKEYFSMNKEIFSKIESISAAASLFSNQTGISISQECMRAWRFWVTFLGFGYLDDMLILPNASVFIQDLMKDSELEKHGLYSAGDFFAALSPRINILLDSNEVLNYGLTCGLLTLSNMGCLNIKQIMDHKVWNMYPIGKKNTVFSTIEILRL